MLTIIVHIHIIHVSWTYTQVQAKKRTYWIKLVPLELTLAERKKKLSKRQREKTKYIQAWTQHGMSVQQSLYLLLHVCACVYIFDVCNFFKLLSLLLRCVCIVKNDESKKKIIHSKLFTFADSFGSISWYIVSRSLCYVCVCWWFVFLFIIAGMRVCVCVHVKATVSVNVFILKVALTRVCALLKSFYKQFGQFRLIRQTSINNKI